jgi:hypothetical protein
VTLCEVGYSRGGAWSAGGTILVGTNYGAGVLRVSDKGRLRSWNYETVRPLGAPTKRIAWTAGNYCELVGATKRLPATVRRPVVPMVPNVLGTLPAFQ